MRPRASALRRSSSAKLPTTSRSASMPSARRADAHAEAEHRDAVRARSDQVERLGAADPLRDLHGIGPHLVEPVRLHRRDRPRDGVFERLRAAESMAERVGQQREAIPRELVGRGRGDHARDRLAIRVDERRRLRAQRRHTQSHRQKPDRPTHPHATEHTLRGRACAAFGVGPARRGSGLAYAVSSTALGPFSDQARPLRSARSRHLADLSSRA